MKAHRMHTQRGSVSLMVAFLLPIFLGLAAFAIDVVYLQVARNELQNDADAAALAGAGYFFDGTNATPRWTLAEQKAHDAIGFNAATGTDNKLIVTNLGGTAIATATVNGMIAPWIIDASTAATPSFVTSGVTGLGPATFAAQATPAALQGAAATVIADVTAAMTLTGAASVQALRVGDFAISGAFNITVGSSAYAGDPAGVIFSTISANRTQANNWVFGTAGAREGVLYAASSSTFSTTLSGTINAVGLTKAGAGSITLTGNNAGIAATALLSGTVTVDQGTLVFTNPNNLGTRAYSGTPYVVDKTALVLAGGNIDTNGTNSATANFLNDVTVLADSAFVNGPTAGASRFGALTFAARQGGATDPTMLSVTQGLVFTGATTLSQAAWFNLATATSGVNATFLGGAVGGTASLEKFGPGTLAFVSGASTMSGPITVHQGMIASLVANAADSRATPSAAAAMWRAISPSSTPSSALARAADFLMRASVFSACAGRFMRLSTLGLPCWKGMSRYGRILPSAISGITLSTCGYG